MNRLYESEIVSRIERLDGKAEVRKIGILNYDHRDYPLFYLITHNTNPSSPNVFISAGIHGDEPAGVYAALDFVKNHAQEYAKEFNFIVFPCLNPWGFEKGRHENLNKFNLNREFRKASPEKEIRLLKIALEHEAKQFCFAIDMHEDEPRQQIKHYPISQNPNGFYLFETCPQEESLGRKIINTLESSSFPICNRDKIYHDKNDNGLVWEPKVTDKGEDDQTTLMCYLEDYSGHVFNPETISSWEFDKRVQSHKIVLETILDEFRKRSEEIKWRTKS
jgi:hypothetical protein